MRCAQDGRFRRCARCGPLLRSGRYPDRRGGTRWRKRTPSPASSRAEDLEVVLRGPLLRPGDGDYDIARAVYNGMIDRSPALIARCHDVADVMAAVRFGAQEDVELAVRGGGHNGAGLGTCDDGLVIDLSPMRGVRVDPRARVAQVEGGALLGDFDHASHAFGLAAPTGIMSTTGIGGLTLGGGLGNLTRRYGLTVDSLLSADVVLADGRLVTADATQHADLFWALRGGGGNFGVVTSFLFRLHPVSTIVGGPTLWHLDDAQDVLRAYAEFLPAAPEDLNGWFAFLTVPPAPPFPEELHGRKMCGIVWCWTGPEDSVHQAVAPMIEAVAPALHGIHPMPIRRCRARSTPSTRRATSGTGAPTSSRSCPADAIALHAQHAAQMPTPQSGMHLYPIDGAAHRVGAQDDRVRLPRRHAGRWSSPGSTPIRPTPSDCGSGASTTGRRCTPTRREAPT